MEVFLYILAAVMTIVMISLFGTVGYGLLIAWFAWCGGVLFDRLFLQPK